MQVKVKVFEDYMLYEKQFIHPIGNYKEKTFNDSDIQNALKQFLNIKKPNDTIEFAKKYGLLNGYDFNILWGVDDVDDNGNYVVFSGSLDTRYNKKYNAKDIDFNMIEKIIIKDWPEIKPSIYLSIFSHGSIYSMFCDIDKHILGFFYDGIAREFHIELPMSKKFSFGAFDCNGKLINSLDGILRFKNSLRGYVNAYLFLLKKLYLKSNKEMSADYLYKCMCEEIGFGYKNTLNIFSWASYQNKLLKQRSLFNSIYDRNKTKKMTRESLYFDYAKTFSKNVKLQYLIDADDNDDYSIKPTIVFNSLYDAFEWLIGSLGNSVKICPMCGDVFIAKRSDAIYCGKKCEKRARDKRKKSNPSSKK